MNFSHISHLPAPWWFSGRPAAPVVARRWRDARETTTAPNARLDHV